MVGQSFTPREGCVYVIGTLFPPGLGGAMKPPKTGKRESPPHSCLPSSPALPSTPILPFFIYCFSSPVYSNGQGMAAQPGEYSSLVRRRVRGHGWELEGLGGLTASALCPAQVPCPSEQSGPQNLAVSSGRCLWECCECPGSHCTANHDLS